MKYTSLSDLVTKYVSGKKSKFSETEYQSLSQKTLDALKIGYYVVRMKDPSCKVYVGNKDGKIWDILISKEDLPKLELALQQLGLEQHNFYGI